MGQAIEVRTDFTASEVRRFAKRAKDAAQARRLLAIAAVLDGVLREVVAKFVEELRGERLIVSQDERGPV